MSIDELIKAASQLDENDLDYLLHQVVALRTRRKTQVLSEAETQLLQVINQDIPPDLRSHYQLLRQKREEETLTESEYETLIQLSNQIEQIGAQRLQALAGLAQLRQVSLGELMESLGIQSAGYV
jgi:hypothetical protein